MTARFGRNKRRQAREEIARLTARIETQNNQLGAMAERLLNAMDAIDDARRYLGRYHAALPPQTFDSADWDASPYNPVNVAVQRSISHFSPESFTEPAQHKIAHLYKLVTSTENRDTPYGTELHARVQYRDGKVGYAITQEALREMPRDYLIRRIAEDMARHLADHLKDKP